MKVTVPHPALFDPLPVASNPSDRRLTPPWLFDALGVVFDLDPAGAEDGDHVPARARYTVAEDGLAQPWHGLVWCNPPYSRVEPWAYRMIDHGNGLMLAPLSVGARWCVAAVGEADAITPLPVIRFLGAGNTERWVSFGILLYAFGFEAVAAASRLPDTFVRCE